MYYATVYIGQSEVSTTVAEREFLVIEPHQMQDGCVQVMDMDFVFNRSEAELVGRTVGHSAFDTASG